MRISAAMLFCSGGLALSLIIARLGVPPRTGLQQNASTLPTRTAVVLARMEESRTDRPVLKHTTLAVVSDTARLLEQMRDGLNSDSPGDQAAVFTNQLLALIRTDPWVGAEFAKSIEVGSWRTEIMRVLAQNWAQLNLPDAEKWVSQISNSDERDTMLGCICFQVAQTDPKLAVQVLERQGLNGDRREIILGNLVRQWASQDLSAAVAWANNYPVNDRSDKLFRQIAYAVSEKSPREAAQMVVELIPPGPIQQEAAMSILQQWGSRNLRDAMAWADLFPSGELADRAGRELASMAAYQAKLSTTGIPEGLLQQ
jgi:hypothetical protein